MNRRLRFAALACSLLLAACAGDPPLDVAAVDLASFQGPWYEIARLSRPAEARCVGTTFHYGLTSDEELDVVVECREGSLDGPLRRIDGFAVATDPRVPAKLTLDSEGFGGEHWIVEVDADYTHAAVGDPSRRRLSILGRLPSLSNADFSALTERLRKKGFDVARLERTLQPGGTESPNDDTVRVTSRWRDTSR